VAKETTGAAVLLRYLAGLPVPPHVRSQPSPGYEVGVEARFAPACAPARGHVQQEDFYNAYGPPAEQALHQHYSKSITKVTSLLFFWFSIFLEKVKSGGFSAS